MSVNSKLLVKFTRPFDNGGSTAGYVLDRGPQFFMLALVSDAIRFDGFNCIRHCDVQQLEAPAGYASFIESALRLRQASRPRKPPVSMASTRAILSGAGRAFPLITIHREELDPEVCHIGQLIAASRGRVTLLEIGPDAVWDTEPSVYNTKEITRIDFGGSYEDALSLVGGPPPEIKRSRRSARPKPSTALP